MKSKIVLLLIILSISYSCNRQNNCDEEISNLTTILDYTRAIYHHHTNYLNEIDLRKKRFNGKQLLNVLSEIDSIFSKIKDSELYYRYSLDENNNISEVTLVSAQLDLGLRVEFDSLLIHLNKELYLVKLTEEDSLRLIQMNESF
jgi:hypothetical protein